MDPFGTASGIQGLIEWLHGGDLFCRRFGANRHIAGDLPVAHHRHRVGAHPVVIAIFTAVFDNSAPRLALLQGVPHIGKSGFRHIRMAHQIMRLTHQLIKLIATHLNKGVVSMSQIAVDVCGRH